MKFKSNQAIYLQISNYICENILNKVWGAGDRIPSIRDLAIELQVNHNTILRTYNHLESCDIIAVKRGLGYSVTEHAINKIMALRRQDFFANELPEFIKSMEVLGIGFDDLKEHIESNVETAEI